MATYPTISNCMTNTTQTEEMTMTSDQWQAMGEAAKWTWEQAHRASITDGAVVQVRATTMAGRSLRDAGEMLTVLRNDGGATLHARNSDGLGLTVETRNVVLCVQQPGAGPAV